MLLLVQRAAGSGEGESEEPTMLAAAADNSFLVADSGHSRLMMIDAARTTVTEVRLIIPGRGLLNLCCFTLDQSCRRLFVGEKAQRNCVT